jgi:hypothetical protein
MREWRYNSTIIDLGIRWRCVQFHAPAALTPGKQKPATIGH